MVYPSLYPLRISPARPAREGLAKYPPAANRTSGLCGARLFGWMRVVPTAGVTTGRVRRDRDRALSRVGALKEQRQASARAMAPAIMLWCNYCG
jgi:hypothetical protein